MIKEVLKSEQSFLGQVIPDRRLYAWLCLTTRPRGALAVLAEASELLVPVTVWSIRPDLLAVGPKISSKSYHAIDISAVVFGSSDVVLIFSSGNV